MFVFITKNSFSKNLRGGGKWDKNNVVGGSCPGCPPPISCVPGTCDATGAGGGGGYNMS